MFSLRTAASIFISLALALGVAATVEPEVAERLESAAVQVRASARAGAEAIANAIAGWNLDLGTGLQLDLRSDAVIDGSASRAAGKSEANLGVEAEGHTAASATAVPLVEGLSQFDLEVGTGLLAEGSLGANSH